MKAIAPRWPTGLLVGLAVTAVVGLAATAEATCSASRIDVTAPWTSMGSRFVVTWQVTPACDVIETGLLLGMADTDPISIGQPVYGARVEYHTDVTVGQTGQYWVVAYARDEAGAMIHSPRHAVFVAVPPSGPMPHGSHGAPPPYTGTDEDFLRQAGRPHFASLRRLEMTSGDLQTLSGSFSVPEASGSARHFVASTHREEVAAAQGAVLSLAGRDFTPSAGDVGAILDTIDTAFAQFGHPRSGLYLVACSVGVTRNVFSAGGCNTDARTFGTLPGSIGAGYSDFLFQQFEIGFRHEATLSTRSSITYFVPRAEPGQRLVSARLTTSFVAFGDAAQMLIGGKPPVDVPARCAGALFCSGFAAWDFTEEGDALASQGGGELTLTIGPIAPADDSTQDVPGRFLRRFEARFALSFNVDYPWRHGGPVGGMMLTFEESCPRRLTISASPTSVRPVIPNAVAPAPASAIVDVSVQTCPPDGRGPATVDIAVAVEPPSTGSPEAAGHLHDTRPAHAQGVLRQAGADATGCTAVIDAEGMGTCTLVYQPSEVSGVETIIATAPGFPEAQTKVTVEVPGLVELPADPTRYVQVGAPHNHADTNDPCRGVPPTSEHSQNHSGLPELNAAVVAIAETMLQETGILLRVNDMSLPRGGLFDIRNDWRTSHLTHRVGRNVDLGFHGIRNGVCTDYETQRLRTVIQRKTRNFPAKEGDHFHVFIP
jgi:hypothetical protein